MDIDEWLRDNPYATTQERYARDLRMADAYLTLQAEVMRLRQEVLQKESSLQYAYDEIQLLQEESAQRRRDVERLLQVGDELAAEFDPGSFAFGTWQRKARYIAQFYTETPEGEPS